MNMPDPTTPIVSDPQSLVDAALSPILTPAPEPIAPPAPTLPTSEPVVEVVPPELVNPLPTLAPLTIEVPAPSTSSVPVGDETPLAFMTPPSTEPVVTPAPVTPPIMTKPKKKMKVGIVVGGVMLLLLFVFGGVAGYQYVTTGEIALIAKVGKGKDTGETKHPEYDQKSNKSWDDVAAEKAAKTTIPVTPVVSDALDQKEIDFLKKSYIVDHGLVSKSGVVPKKIGDVNLDDPDWSEVVGLVDQNGQFQLAQQKTDNQTAAQEIQDRCETGDTGCPTDCSVHGVDQNTAGWTKVTEPGGGSYCEGTKGCSRYRIEMRQGPSGGTHCFLGYGANCGGEDSCGGDTTTTTTTTTASPAPSLPPATLTMACMGLTRTPTTTPAIGSVLTFTCAGTVTPATAGTLSYKYRYSINSGTYKLMTSNTLTIAACGTYSVECQACATLNGVLTCDPTWTGATQ